eukprot:COSAG02_NODE_1454_length_12536_cov_347.064163_6_plen_80_part_00
MALSQTLEEYMMGAWNHFAFSMSPTGFTYTMDGEVLPDTVHGIFMHYNFWDGNKLSDLYSNMTVLMHLGHSIRTTRTLY